MDIAGEFRGEIQLLIIDVVLPGIKGPELAESLTAASKVRRILFISGYSEDAIAQTGIGSPGNFLAKPFSAESLIRKVQEILAGI